MYGLACCVRGQMRPVLVHARQDTDIRTFECLGRLIEPFEQEREGVGM